uniref:Uncharacterized protein n=1 Tax=Megaselia scalaris TaxID=36166 RepID=T1GYD6_MEGSC
MCPSLGREGWLRDIDNCNRYFRCYRENNQLIQLKMDVTGICQNSPYAGSCSAAGFCSNKQTGYYANPTDVTKSLDR